jgi:hypothetical protein
MKHLISVIFAVLSLGVISFGTMSLGSSLASADAAVRDGQSCSTEMRPGPWNMRPDGCFLVSPYGGHIELPTAATEIDIWTAKGHHLKQHGNVFMRRNGYPIVTMSRDPWSAGRRPPTVVNGYFAPIRVYWWAS